MNRKTISVRVAIITIATTMTTACDSIGYDNTQVAVNMTIETSINEPTATMVNQGGFEPNDQISIYSWTGDKTAVGNLVVDNAINKYNGTTWEPTPAMPWKDESSEHYFIGIHPSKAVSDFTADSYNSTPDLLVATNTDGRNATQGNIPLVFDHVMAKLVVKLTFRNQFGETTPTVSDVNTTAMRGATVNYLSKTATAVPVNGNETIAMTPTTPNTAYECIAAPQTISKIEIIIDGKTYTYNNPQGFSLEGGKIRTIELFVGLDLVELGNVTINNWGKSEDIVGGEAQ